AGYGARADPPRVASGAQVIASGLALGALALLRPNALAAMRARVLERAARAAEERGLEPISAGIQPPSSALRPKLAAAGATALVGIATWVAWPRSSTGDAHAAALAEWRRERLDS